MQAASDLEQSGRSIMHLEVGQPGTPAPEAARSAISAAITTEKLGYTVALGTAPLRARIARHYRETYGVNVQPERIIITSGSSGGFVLAFLALFDAGARVALPSPGYPCYRHILTALNCRPEIIKTGPDTRWMPTTDLIAQTHKRSPLDGMLIASPANPTGTMAPPETLESLTEFCTDNGIAFISDEIYHGLTYTEPATTALSFSNDVIVINSFSKYFSMAGWRVGWMVVPEPLIRPIECLQQNLFISAPAPSQTAALAAFDSLDELEKLRQAYQTKRDVLLDVLMSRGLTSNAPADGAFYIYTDVSGYTDCSKTFATQMLNEIGVATTPGIDFDEERGRQYLRLSYSTATPHIEEAARRLASWPRLGTN